MKGRFRNRAISGFVILLPLVLTLYVVQLLVGLTGSIVLPMLGPAFSAWPAWTRSLLAVGVLLAACYLIGELAARVVGRRVVESSEALVMRVPFVKSIYRSIRQIVEAFSRPRGSTMRSVALVDFPRAGAKSIGFVTGHTIGPDGARWKLVFVPTTPNPTTGFLQLLPDGDVQPIDLSVDEAFKTVMSIGTLAPERFDKDDVVVGS